METTHSHDHNIFMSIFTKSYNIIYIVASDQIHQELLQ